MDKLIEKKWLFVFTLILSPKLLFLYAPALITNIKEYYIRILQIDLNFEFLILFYRHWYISNIYTHIHEKQIKLSHNLIYK